jgi:hypothetical protein
MGTQLLKNGKLNYRKYLAGISIPPPAEVIRWQDRSGNNNHLLAKTKKRTLLCLKSSTPCNG